MKDHIDNGMNLKEKLTSLKTSDKALELGKLLSYKEIEAVMKVVSTHTQSKLKALAGDIEKAIGEKEVSEYKQFDPNDEMILADQLIYDCRNDYRAELRESLKAIKERLIK